jgi:GAF domain-containing protein
MEAPIPNNEPERLKALQDYHILDTSAEQAYDDITELAAAICQVPISVISLVDESRQWFKSKLGVKASETPRNIAFCAHTILSAEPLIVNDALNDRRFADSPLVNDSPRVRFYAGFPLIAPNGCALGSLCAIDRKPGRLTKAQISAMDALARQVMISMELRRVSSRLVEALEQVSTLRKLIPLCAWCHRVREDDGYWKDIESYFRAQGNGDVTHSICPDCLKQQTSEEVL